MDIKKIKKSGRSSSDGYWEKYFILAGGLNPDWDCYNLRDFVKPVTERIWVNVEPYHMENPSRIGQVGSITVNGREDAKKLYTTLFYFQKTDGGHFLLHLWNISDNTKYVRCNCDMHSLTHLCPANALAVYMRTQAPTRIYGPVSMDPIPQLQPPVPYLPVDTRFFAITGQIGMQQQQQLLPYQTNPYALSTRQPLPAGYYSVPWTHVPYIPRNGGNENQYRAIHVGQLHDDATEEHLRNMFHEIGISPIHVHIEQRGKGRAAGMAEVIVSTLEDAVRAIGHLNGYKIMGRRVTVRYQQNDSNLIQTALNAGLATFKKDRSNLYAYSTDGSSTASEASKLSTGSDSPPIVNGSRL